MDLYGESNQGEKMKFRKLLNMLRNSKQLFKSLWNDNPQRTIELVDHGLWEWNGSSKKEKDKRIAKKPIEIFEEIVSEKPKINLNNLDGQIKLVKERIKVLSQHLRRVNLDQEEQALGYLKARKRYERFGNKFKWEITNKVLIDKLCKKYKVKLVDIHQYYRNIPKEGVDEIERFGEALEYINNCEPLFKLIIDDGGKETRKDPILLAASPFGNWYYILGAWDKEVEIVDKLIYKGK